MSLTDQFTVHPSQYRRHSDDGDNPVGRVLPNVTRAEVNVNLTAPFPSWNWLKLQILGIKLANVALLIAVLAVSANTSAQLDQQRAENIVTQDQPAASPVQCDQRWQSAAIEKRAHAGVQRSD